jgi:predicted exporter
MQGSSAKLAAAVTVCLNFLERRRGVFLFLFAAAILACAFSSLKLVSRDDVGALVPDGRSRAAEYFAYMREAPFLHTLSITVGGEGTDPRALSDALIGMLKRRGIPFAAGGPGTMFAAADPPRFLACLPALLPPERMALFGEKLNADAVRTALRRDRRLLLGPSGPALRGLIAADPLGVREAFFRTVVPMQKAAGIPTRNGYFTDVSGAYCMVIAKPAQAMTDASASAALMKSVRDALAGLPEGTETLITGSYRHSEANGAIIASDLKRVVPVSFLLISALFLIFLRDKRALAIFAVPPAALCVACAATAFFHRPLSGIVLGFGSVILGITADYAIHTYYAVTGSGNAERGVAGLCPPLLTGACTTACAFAALYCSGIPAIRQMATFGLFGVGTALAVSLLALPLLLRSGGDADEHPPATRPPRCRPALTAAAVGLSGLFILWASSTLRPDGDIRNLSYASPEIAEDEKRAKAVWNTPTSISFIVAAADGTDEGFERALRVNDRVWALLLENGIPASGLAPFLPSRQRQAESAAAWKALWDARGDEVMSELNRTAPQLGFAPEAFAPFRDWIAAPPAEVGPETLRSQGFDFLLAMFSVRTDERSLLYTILPDGFEPDAALRRSLHDAGAAYVSGTDFRQAVAEAVGDDIFRFCLSTVVAVVGAVCLVFRSPARCAAVLLPTLAGLAFTLFLFRITGTAVNMFHAAALPLVIALSVDYGIFMQAVIEGRMRKNAGTGVLLSALTTLAGFGSLLPAGHPALSSLGLAVTGGIAAALAAALLLQPALFLKRENA